MSREEWIWKCSTSECSLSKCKIMKHPNLDLDDDIGRDLLVHLASLVEHAHHRQRMTTDHDDAILTETCLIDGNKVKKGTKKMRTLWKDW